MTTTEIKVKGAREHNLRDVNLTLPRGKLICFSGVSGSGKSSLAFDTLYAEGQRRYVESLSPYARQFVGQVPKPIFEKINTPNFNSSKNNETINVRNWDMLRNLLFKFEDFARLQIDIHGLASPKKPDGSAASIDL